MQPQQTIATKQHETATKQHETLSSPVFVEPEKLAEQVKELSQSVAHRAYQFFEERGRAIGNDLDDWFRAELELTRQVPVEIKEAENQISVRAEVPGFAAGEIKISVEPKRLVISGKSEKTTDDEKEQTVFSEFRSRQFSRELTLPAEVDPAKAKAVLKNGVLEVTLAQAHASERFEFWQIGDYFPGLIASFAYSILAPNLLIPLST